MATVELSIQEISQLQRKIIDIGMLLTACDDFDENETLQEADGLLEEIYQTLDEYVGCDAALAAMGIKIGKYAET